MTPSGALILNCAPVTQSEPRLPQVVEAGVTCNILNQMTELGRPRVGGGTVA